MLAGCGGGSNAQPDARPVGDDASIDGGIADGGIADAAAGDAAFDETPNYVFVTAMSFDGNLGDIAGADAICNGASGLAGLPGQYVAWLSTDDVDAIDRLADARGWVRPDGQPFADRPSDIADSKVFYPPVVTEMMTFPPERRVWTATAANGRFKPDAGDCDGWTSIDSELSGGTGTSVGGSVAFTDDRGATARCDETRSLLCFGIDYTAQVKPQDEGRIAFTTRATIAGSAGLDNMDDLCDSEASQAGLEGTFLALVSLAGSPGPERFNGAAATWIRLDGVRLYATAQDLGNGDRPDRPR